MSKSIQLDVITPAGVVFSETVDYLSVESSDGSLGILPQHVPIFSVLDIGVLEYERNGERDFITTMGGVFEYKKGHAVALVSTAEKAMDIDELRAKSALERAQAEATAVAGEKAAAEADKNLALRRAATRLRVVELLQHRHKRRRIGK